MVIATVYVDYMPTEKQAAFHRCGADEALYGGAAGGGKSRAVVMEALVPVSYTHLTLPTT